jgi:primosomal protein N' (replication factor Y)
VAELLADVGVPAPLAEALSYRVPAALADRARPGARVLCELGARKVVGIVLDVASRVPAVAPEKLKPIAAVIDETPAMPGELLAFLRELATYYYAPIGEVLRLALPALERDRLRELETQGKLALGEAPARARQVGGRRRAFARPTDRVEPPGALRGQAAAVLALLRASGEQPVAALEARHAGARAAVRKLVALGLVLVESRAVASPPALAPPPAPDAPPELNDAQRSAAERIIESDLAGPRGFLLFGVTGSGKTEVYMRAIARVLDRGGSAIVLVPEIALTPQLLGRFRARFGDAVALLHSGLGEPARHEMWKRLRAGELRVAVGARSALFAPVERLGLVVVDEEHDASFKQEEGVRYHARDMALLRAHRAGAVVVLGSATPSLETMALARQGRLELLRLPARATQAALPAVAAIDLKRVGAGPSGDRRLSLPLHRALEETLAAGEQAILFLNRRGFAPAVACDGCGIVLSCAQCSVALTYHRSGGGRVQCHYCDHRAALPERCPECHRAALGLEGLGTEKLEETVARAFPHARVARLDRDVAAGARSERVLARMRAGEIDVLVGTQMVTKGHDLPRVTLVGVVNADAALGMPDFRAAERGFQLLVQVAGRAGRHDRPGRVLVQTRDPAHPAVRFALAHDVEGFVAGELADRRELGYPPFRRLALLRVDAADESTARRVAAELAAHARSAPEVARGSVEVLGPAPAPIARLRGRYRFRVLLRGRERKYLRAVLDAVAAARVKTDRRARAVIDVDPVAML